MLSAIFNFKKKQTTHQKEKKKKLLFKNRKKKELENIKLFGLAYISYFPLFVLIPVLLLVLWSNSQITHIKENFYKGTPLFFSFCVVSHMKGAQENSNLN